MTMSSTRRSPRAPMARCSGTRWKQELLPRVKTFLPDLIVISAGFDAHRLDPLGGLDLVEADFVWATTRLMEIAERHAKGRIVSVLEGGYHLEGLARSVAAHVAALMGA